MVRYLIVVIAVFVLCVGCEKASDVPKYINNLRSSDPHARSNAAMSLGRIGAPHSVKAVPVLISLLDDSNPGVQSAAAYALRRIDTKEARAALDRHRRFQ